MSLMLRQTNGLLSAWGRRVSRKRFRWIGKQAPLWVWRRAQVPLPLWLIWAKMAHEGLGFTAANAAATGISMSMISEFKFDKLAWLSGKHNYKMVTFWLYVFLFCNEATASIASIIYL